MPAISKLHNAMFVKSDLKKIFSAFSWFREGEEGMAGAALLATQSKLGRPLLQDEIHFIRLQVVSGSHS